MGQGPKWTDAQRAARLSKLVERNRAGHTGERRYEDADWMRESYVTRGLSLREMAIEAACGLRTIARWMQIHKIPTNTGRKPQYHYGPDHHSWTGGPPKCVKCRCEISRTATTGHCVHCLDRSGENNSKWRGDNIEYTALHNRLVVERGLPAEYQCARCPEQASEWAYDHEDPDERRNLVGRDDGPFSLNLAHYMPLCVRCHRRFDNGRRKKAS